MATTGATSTLLGPASYSIPGSTYSISLANSLTQSHPKSVLGKRKSLPSEESRMDHRDIKRRPSNYGNPASSVDPHRRPSYQYESSGPPQYVAPQDLASSGGYRPPSSGQGPAQHFEHAASTPSSYNYSTYPSYYNSRGTSAPATTGYGAGYPYRGGAQQPQQFYSDAQYHSASAVPQESSHHSYSGYHHLEPVLLWLSIQEWLTQHFRYQAGSGGTSSVPSVYSSYPSQSPQPTPSEYPARDSRSGRLHGHSLPPLASSAGAASYPQPSSGYSLPSTQPEPQRPKPQCWE